MSRRGSKRGREARYAAAVQRQIEANDRWDQAEPAERMYMARPAPVTAVLRRGDVAPGSPGTDTPTGT